MNLNVSELVEVFAQKSALESSIMQSAVFQS